MCLDLELGHGYIWISRQFASSQQRRSYSHQYSAGLSGYRTVFVKCTHTHTYTRKHVHIHTDTYTYPANMTNTVRDRAAPAFICFVLYRRLIALLLA